MCYNKLITALDSAATALETAIKKKLFSVLLGVLMVFSYTGCTQVQNHSEHLEDYIFTLQYHDDFNILQLTDIHWSANTSVRSSTQYLDKLLKDVNDHIVSSQGADAGMVVGKTIPIYVETTE